MELNSLYVAAEMQATALHETLEAIHEAVAKARGTSPSVGTSLEGMYAFEAGKAAEFCRSMTSPGASTALPKP